MSRWLYFRNPASLLSLNRVVRLNSNGSLDTSFNTGTGANASVVQSAVQSDGKIVVVGSFTVFNGVALNRIARLNSDGSLDPSFNPGIGAINYISSVAIQGDGKIVIGGGFYSFNGTTVPRLARLNTNGTLDASFIPGSGPNLAVNAVYVLSSGKLLIAGSFTTYDGAAANSMCRLNANGTLDTSFAPGTDFTPTGVSSVGIQTDGKYVVTGSFTSFGGTAYGRILRLNTDGTLDSGYGTGTGFNQSVYAAQVRSDGKVYCCGRFTAYNGVTRKGVIRINTDGTVDTSFDPGTGTAFYYVYTNKVQADGKVVIGGQFISYGGVSINRIARINADATLDLSFYPGAGANASVNDVMIQSDGKIIVVGDFTAYVG